MKKLDRWISWKEQDPEAYIALTGNCFLCGAGLVVCSILILLQILL